MTLDTKPGVVRAPLRNSVPSRRGHGRARKRFNTRTVLTILAFLAPAAIFTGIFVYYPMISGSQMAFRNWNLNDLSNTDWIGFGNFRQLFDLSLIHI